MSTERSVNGDWRGIVNYAIRYADGRAGKYTLHHQLVPALALRPREKRVKIGRT